MRRVFTEEEEEVYRSKFSIFNTDTEIANCAIEDCWSPGNSFSRPMKRH
jgi:hypothetical protein